MNQTILLEQLQEIARIVFADKVLQINEETTAKDVADWDSLNHIRFIVEIENRFNMEFEIEELIEINSIGDIISTLLKK